jgi:hypothetical protein
MKGCYHDEQLGWSQILEPNARVHAAKTELISEIPVRNYDTTGTLSIYMYVREPRASVRIV